MTKKINGKTEIFSVIGNPIEHSLSPQIHNTIYEYMNLNYNYVPFKVDSAELKTAIQGIKSLGIKGFNVTIPHKQKIIPYLDKVSEEAMLVGSVNTVKTTDGKLCGYTTDGEGFIKSLNRNNVNIKGKKVLVIGAGGSSRSISIRMAAEEIRSIIILNRTTEKAKAICDIINKNIKPIAIADVFNDTKFNIYSEEADIIVNTTPVGMYPNNEKCPIDSFISLRPDTVVCDLIYNPRVTQFLSKAENKGCKTINGWGMLIFQAIAAFEIWTNKKVDDKLIEILYNRIVE
jgi:shikimate dehydrogenase